MNSLARRNLAAFLTLTALLAGQSFTQKFSYPPAHRDSVVDNYHGTKVADPYRWMEDPDSKDLQQWIEAENTLTHNYIDTFPDKEKVRARLTELWNYPKFTIPSREGNRYAFSVNNGLQNQYVLYTRVVGDADSSMLLDPNTLSTDGTVALNGQWFSYDGSLFAYALSSSGSDWQEIHIRDVATGKDVSEVLKWCKFTSVAWKHDNSGFYYSRYPKPGEGGESVSNMVYWHALHTQQSADKLVYKDASSKELLFSPFITDDGRYLALDVNHGSDVQDRIYYRDVSTSDPFTHLLDEGDARYSFLGNDGQTFFFNTDNNAPRGRIIAIDLDHADVGVWREIVPQQGDVISSAALIHHTFVVVSLHDAHSLVTLYDMAGNKIKEIELPTVGTVGGITGRPQDDEMFISFTSFLYPTTVFRYNFINDSLSTYRAPEIKFNPAEYESKQVFCNSTDGTRVPIFLTYKKGIKMDGTNPVFMYGYGGFGINMTPSFSTPRVIWLENGGIYAQVVLRGGSEYGEEWHKAGMLEHKQNVFDDFISAGRYLINEKYTDTSRLAINGGSNGGLLVAACMIQQPKLFGAVVCNVPVTDMLRFHKFTIGRFWTGEYGNAETSAEQFKFMYTYSPLQNVKKGETYPPMLITTADHDDRVVPAHSMKLAATLQYCDAGTNPILLRVDTKAGHGGGKPTAKIIDELTDTYSFLFKTFKMSVGGGK